MKFSEHSYEHPDLCLNLNPKVLMFSSCSVQCSARMLQIARCYEQNVLIKAVAVVSPIIVLFY